jgi:hypothetical protein
LIIFLLEEYKRSRFVELCRELRGGSDFYAAIEKVYKIKDATELNSNFLSYLDSLIYEDIVNK